MLIMLGLADGAAAAPGFPGITYQATLGPRCERMSSRSRSLVLALIASIAWLTCSSASGLNDLASAISRSMEVFKSIDITVKPVSDSGSGGSDFLLKAG